MIKQHADVTFRGRRIKARCPGNRGCHEARLASTRSGPSRRGVARLQPVYDRSTDGFDTTDLKAANSLLDALE
jgi:hypothetical protein